MIDTLPRPAPPPQGPEGLPQPGAYADFPPLQPMAEAVVPPAPVMSEGATGASTERRVGMWRRATGALRNLIGNALGGLQTEAPKHIKKPPLADRIAAHTVEETRSRDRLLGTTAAAVAATEDQWKPESRERFPQGPDDSQPATSGRNASTVELKDHPLHPSVVERVQALLPNNVRIVPAEVEQPVATPGLARRQPGATMARRAELDTGRRKAEEAAAAAPTSTDKASEKPWGEPVASTWPEMPTATPNVAATSTVDVPEDVGERLASLDLGALRVLPKVTKDQIVSEGGQMRTPTPAEGDSFDRNNPRLNGLIAARNRAKRLGIPMMELTDNPLDPSVAERVQAMLPSDSIVRFVPTEVEQPAAPADGLARRKPGVAVAGRADPTQN